MLIRWRGELVCFTVCKFYLKKKCSRQKMWGWGSAEHAVYCCWTESVWDVTEWELSLDKSGGGDHWAPPGARCFVLTGMHWAQSKRLMPPTLYKLCFIVLTDTVFCFVLFLQIEGLWPLQVQQVCGHHLSNAVCSLHVSVSQCGKPGSVSNFLLLFSIYLQWPVVNLFSFFVICILFNWRIIALQCRVGFSVQQGESAINIHMSPPPLQSILVC